MADDLITIQLRLTGGTAAAAEARKVSGAVGGIGDTTHASTTKAATATSRFRSTLSSLGRTMAFATIPVVGALGYEVVKSVNAYREAAKIGDQTNAVIKSTGGAAKITADEVARLSETLSLKTGVDDEEIQAGANMLLTFKNLRNEAGKGNDVFSQSLAVVNDMSSALGTDLKSSAIQVGKALNDPTVGLTALSRAGVTFSTKQKATIQRLFETGQGLKAQKIILRELTSEFGGSASAQHDAVDKLGVAWENLEEKLGEAVYPILKDVTQWLTKALRQAQKGKGPLTDLKNWFGDLGRELEPVVNTLGDFISAMKWITDHANQISDFANIGGEFGPGSGGIDTNAGVDITGGGGRDPSNPPLPPGFEDYLPRLRGGGKLPDLVAPPRRRQGGGRGKRGPLVVNVMLPNGKRLAGAVVDEAEIARAWG